MKLCDGAVNNGSLSADSCHDWGLRPCHTLPAAVNVKTQVSTQNMLLRDTALRLMGANKFTFFFFLNDLWAPNMRIITFIRYKVKCLKEHRCHPRISLPKQALMMSTEAAACTDRTRHAGRHRSVRPRSAERGRGSLASCWWQLWSYGRKSF